VESVTHQLVEGAAHTILVFSEIIQVLTHGDTCAAAHWAVSRIGAGFVGGWCSILDAASDIHDLVRHFGRNDRHFGVLNSKDKDELS
jgi:hypothetical protein